MQSAGIFPLGWGGLQIERGEGSGQGSKEAAGTAISGPGVRPGGSAAEWPGRNRERHREILKGNCQVGYSQGYSEGVLCWEVDLCGLSLGSPSFLVAVSASVSGD